MRPCIRAHSSKGDNERLPGRFARRRQQIRVVVWHGDGKKEDAQQEDAADAPEDGFDGLGHVARWVGRLSSSKSDHFATAVLQRCKDEDFEDTFSAVGERAGVMVEFEPNLLAAEDAGCYEDCAEKEGEDGEDFDEG